MKRVAVFLVVLLFVPLVLRGQISNQTVGGWKATGTKGIVTKAYSRIISDTVVIGHHSQSFVGVFNNNSSITYEKKYLQIFQKIGNNQGIIWIYTKKMDYSGYVDIFTSFGKDNNYSNPFVALLIPGSMIGGFYPITFTVESAPDSFNNVRFEFVSHGVNSFEIFLDGFGMNNDGGVYPTGLIIDDFEDTTVPVRDEAVIPNSFKLYQNYPNPFNPETKIRFELSSTKFVKLQVFDALGREVETLVNEEKLPGSYEIQFNGSKLSSGTYFYRLSVGNYTETKKILLIK